MRGVPPGSSVRDENLLGKKKFLKSIHLNITRLMNGVRSFGGGRCIYEYWCRCKRRRVFQVLIGRCAEAAGATANKAPNNFGNKEAQQI